MPFWDALRRVGAVRNALLGVNAAVVGLLLAALYDPVWTSAILSPADFGLALAAFTLLVFWKTPCLAGCNPDRTWRLGAPCRVGVVNVQSPKTDQRTAGRMPGSNLLNPTNIKIMAPHRNSGPFVLILGEDWKQIRSSQIGKMKTRPLLQDLKWSFPLVGRLR